ncbi:MAG: hypothetical protein J5896_00385 [Alphaproteobacteria bacterium]|nr:hypothetical protein [Alphaproteobacteria bacterium]
MKSRLISKDTDDEKLKEAFDRKFYAMDFGRRMEHGRYLFGKYDPIRTVQKGDDIYHVCNTTFFGTERDRKLGEIYVHTYATLIEKDGQFSLIYTTAKRQHIGAVFEDISAEFVYKNNTVQLEKNTDVYDIDAVRFQLRHNKEAKQMIDDFVLVTSAQRNDYRLYKIDKVLQEKKKKLYESKIFNLAKKQSLEM